MENALCGLSMLNKVIHISSAPLPLCASALIFTQKPKKYDCERIIIKYLQKSINRRNQYIRMFSIIKFIFDNFK